MDPSVHQKVKMSVFTSRSGDSGDRKEGGGGEEELGSPLMEA